MKNLTSILTFIVFVALATWRFYNLMPQAEYAPKEISTENVLKHIKTISKNPHFVGTEAHKVVKQYIVSQLQGIGLKTVVQQGYTSGDWGNLSKAENIIATIKGTGNSQKALVLMSHYDSNPHSSLGASDDAVGVSIILEAVKSFIEKDKAPKNDIIILFTDAEELGLNGAQLFVKEHPLAQKIGLILNFEARGSGGPSYMLIETNGGNKNMIESFNNSGVQFPVANSLAYSIYKMLPNDTDLTVFREDADVEGFNFAFIDDHFDYHTANDSYERVNKKTVQHQISYLLPLLDYYANYNLNGIKANTDYIYFDFPVFNFVYYPFSWIFPMLILAIVLLIVFVIIGIKNKKLTGKGMFNGFLAFFISFILAGLIGYFCWPALKSIYPQYADILQGFTYNGHFYIAGFTALAFGINFYIYSKFKKTTTSELLIAPIFMWILICCATAMYLKGASFFIIPVYGALAALFISINKKRKKSATLFLIILCVPALWIIAPLIQMFPVGLGLKVLVSSCILSVLLFGLLLPVFGSYKNKKTFSLLSFVVCAFFLVAAHFQSGFTKERPHPASLVYMLDADTNKAEWATYNHILDPWTAQYLGDEKQKPGPGNDFSSKYGTGFSYISKAPLKNIPPPDIAIISDTIYTDKRHVTLCVTPRRNVNRLEVLTNDVEIVSCTANGIALSNDFLKNRNQRLLTHFISNNEYTELNLVFNSKDKPQLIFYEASNNLLSHPLFSVPKRPDNSIPMPFVLNDAIVTKKTLQL
ncbi:M20/M25/M40 family metallo-hydrolase [Galbibacter pacificus]|uniref:Vacuolar membrane protease n=1 Tax=Galbibacter pacificus TaxID=2996052 RepID=A0ABT6FTB8_9FLAO|nr:M20/M25/M40 family metallo-hydrolase [Galbibacter pacificus]MDG3583031.1 M20/M25/M40 family metallo-hydrolase [Galbibacter pacificus]MDG3586512.1 M20/M25/M40 family metallo-hydrolase [Galbibacter pacificus]